MSRGPGYPRPALSPRLLVGLLLAGVLGAGCAESGSSKGPPGADAGPAAEGRTVTGTVVDEELRPLSGAEIRHVGGNATALTDPAGRFDLGGLPADASVRLSAGLGGYLAQTLRVDLLYVPSAEIRFVLPAAPSTEASHYTNTTVGQITCQVAAGSHHGFPGFYRRSCADVMGNSRERVRVPVNAGVVAGVIELTWQPQSQFADIMGLTSYLSTSREELLLAALHSLPGKHYVHFYTGTRAMEGATPQGGILDSLVHVDPGVVDEHVPTNAGVVIQQDFTLHTTAFYGEPPMPSWSYVPR